MPCWPLLLLFFSTTYAYQKFFMKLFADAGIGIHCPSENKVYIHPISGDLQQCSQQLGNYNETSCPDGTVCERFPILIPGFQDYCCWADSSITDSESTVIGPTTEIPDELIPFTEKPPMRKLVVTAAPEIPDYGENEDSNEEWMETTTTRRTRNRKTTTTTTEEPETTTKKVISHRRLPRCSNPDAQPLIDFGNRLRDCGFQPCNRGYICEYNREIRKRICCGQSPVIVPPAGLPMIPAPKPLIPRPMRPRPFGPMNEGDDEYSNGNQNGNQNRPYDGCGQSGCGMEKGNNQGQWNDGGCNFGSNSGCNFGPNNGRSNSGNGNGNGMNGEGCPYSNQGGQGCGWNQNNMETQGQPTPRMIGPLPEPKPLTGARPQEPQQEWSNTNNNNNGFMPSPRPSPRTQQPYQPNWGDDGFEGNNKVTNQVNWGPQNWENNNNNNNFNGNSDNMGWENGGDRWDNSPRPSVGQPPRQQNSGPPMGERWEQSPPPRQQNWEKSGQGERWEEPQPRQQNWENSGPSERWEQPPPRQENWENGGNWNNGPSNQGQWENGPSQQQWEGPRTAEPNLRSFQWNKIGMGSSMGSGKPMSSGGETCGAGSTYQLQGTAPKCTPPGSDSCPLSHPRCIMSESLGHHVCCF